MSSRFTVAPARRLAIGERVQVPVESRLTANRLGVQVARGEAYSFVTTGDWSDGSIASDAGGYAIGTAPIVSRLFLWLGKPIVRLTRAPYFALIIHVERAPKREWLVAGAGMPRWAAGRTGELVGFANDVPFMYGNNSGAVVLTIQRLA